MKKIKASYLLTVIIFLLIIIALQYSYNRKIEIQQGQIIESKIDLMRSQLKSSLDILSPSEIPKAEDINRSFEKLSEDTWLLPGIMPGTMILTYLDMIKVDLNRISQDIKNKKSEEEINADKKLALNKITVLLNEFSYIKESCGTNSIKYFKLNKIDNAIVKKADKDMLDYLNKNNIH